MPKRIVVIYDKDKKIKITDFGNIGVIFDLLVFMLSGSQLIELTEQLKSYLKFYLDSEF